VRQGTSGCVTGKRAHAVQFRVHFAAAPSTNALCSGVYTLVTLPRAVARHNTPIHNILSTAPQLGISQQALGTLPEGDNVMPKHVGATIHN
jgi:hypothetical protein